MDQQELDLLQKYAATNPDLKALWDDHLLYDRQVEKLENKSFRTPSEQQTLKQLKKQKLEGKTRMMDLLYKLKQEEAAN